MSEITYVDYDGDPHAVGDEIDGYVVCSPDYGVYESPWHPDSPLCQYGNCGPCGIKTISVAKHAICARCGVEVYGT